MATELDLTLAIKLAAKRAYEELMRQHDTEEFYYFALITTGEAHPPFVSAWSVEALDAAINNEKDNEAERLSLKWSYADTPYCGFGENYFEEVRRLFLSRPSIHSLENSERVEEFELRMRAMENAIRELNNEGLFGSGADRNSIVVNVEVMPPDQSNTERALRLNPPLSLKNWINEAAEM